VRDALSLLALPFAACVIFVAIHAYLGLHVLRRQIIFADLALAQLSALGATLAFAAGHPPASAGSFAYTLLLTGIGAILLTLSRGLPRRVGQEAFIGILYVVGTAATVLVVDRSPQGAEHVKRMLVGSILTLGPEDVVRLALIYAPIGLLLWLARRPILALSSEAEGTRYGRAEAAFWDFVFYLCFGVVVSSSVAATGVLVVFSFLIVPAVAGTIFASRLGVQLAIGWGLGVAASAAGLAASYAGDLPTGAALVVSFALALLLACFVRLFAVADPATRRRNRRQAASAAAGVALGLILAASLWMLALPRADQPILALLDHATGIGPERFMTAGERAAFGEALIAGERFRREAERMDALEKATRWQGAPLSADEVRRLSSYMQSFNEMARGEDFVADHLRGRARERERWYAGLPLAGLSLAGLIWLARRSLRARRRHATEPVA